MSEEWSGEFSRVAARFWADQLRHGDGPSAIRDAGYASEGPESFARGVFMDVLVGMNRRNLPTLEPEQIDRFEDELAYSQMANLYRHLATDYHPCRDLTNAMTAAGIGTKDADMRFTWKTATYVGADGVEVVKGRERWWLVRTKRGVLFEEVDRRLHASDLYPYAPDGRALVEDEKERSKKRDAFYAYVDRLHRLRNKMPPFPSGALESLAKSVYDVVCAA